MLQDQGADVLGANRRAGIVLCVVDQRVHGVLGRGERDREPRDLLDALEGRARLDDDPPAEDLAPILTKFGERAAVGRGEASEERAGTIARFDRGDPIQRRVVNSEPFTDCAYPFRRLVRLLSEDRKLNRKEP